MSKIVKNIIQFVIFISFGALLFWLVYRDTDWHQLLNGIKQVNYYWFILIVLIGLLSHVSRAIRWNLLINPLGYKTRFWNTFFAVMIGYLANLAVPRLGEVARCGVVAKYDKVPVSKVLGTMITERVIDMLTVPLFIIVALLAGSGLIQDFFTTNPDVNSKMSSIFSLTNILIFVLIIAIGLFMFVLLLKGKFDKILFFKKIKNFARNLFDGLMSIRYVKKKFWFIFHSLLIWICYYMMVVVSMPAFGFTQDLGLQAALIVFLAGSFGMIAPAPNGIGAYHFMVIQSLLLFGIAREDADLFAFLIHTFQTLLLLLAGLFSLIMLPIINRVQNIENSPIVESES